MAKSSDVDILIVPGWSGSGPDHWQTRWERRLASARRVEGVDWDQPRRSAWREAIVAAIAESKRPVVIVAHSLGVIAAADALGFLDAAGRPSAVAGAFLAAPADIENTADWPGPKADMFGRLDSGFDRVPVGALACPTLLVASQTDPYCRFTRAADFARQWGADLVDGGDAGHINVESGHGPWPEGLLQFGGLLRRLPA